MWKQKRLAYIEGRASTIIQLDGQLRKNDQRTNNSRTTKAFPIVRIYRWGGGGGGGDIHT